MNNMNNMNNNMNNNMSMNMDPNPQSPILKNNNFKHLFYFKIII